MAGSQDARCHTTTLDPSVSGPNKPPATARPASGHKRLEFSSVTAPRATHYLFRFPAKFHPPVVHTLLQEYTTPGQTVLDPFCGSGTLLVAAALERRHAVGVDVDPVAVFVSKWKTHRYRTTHLQGSWNRLRLQLQALERPQDEYLDRRFKDISVDDFNSSTTLQRLPIPGIPNLFHWFRRYVIIDLARIKVCIENTEMPETHKGFFWLIFASIIRNSSNADPIPISGLEVTRHMKMLDKAGRLVNPYELFYKAVVKGLRAVSEYSDLSRPETNISVTQADTTCLGGRIRRPIDTIITSPPYHGAVDYYRRHQLEMYWLDLTINHAQRLQLLPKYIGRPSIGRRDPILRHRAQLSPIAARWYEKIREQSPARARVLVHYVLSMKAVLFQLARVVPTGGKVVFVLGHSKWNGYRLPTSDMLVEGSEKWFHLIERRWYPVKNHYMSYSRHNGATINEDHVIVLSRRKV